MDKLQQEFARNLPLFPYYYSGIKLFSEITTELVEVLKPQTHTFKNPVIIQLHTEGIHKWGFHNLIKRGYIWMNTVGIVPYFGGSLACYNFFML